MDADEKSKIRFFLAIGSIAFGRNRNRARLRSEERAARAGALERNDKAGGKNCYVNRSSVHYATDSTYYVAILFIYNKMLDEGV